MSLSTFTLQKAEPSHLLVDGVGKSTLVSSELVCDTDGQERKIESETLLTSHGPHTLIFPLQSLCKTTATEGCALRYLAIEEEE